MKSREQPRNKRNTEIYTIFLHWKNQYPLKALYNILKYNILKKQSTDSKQYRTTNGIFHRIRRKKFTIRMKTKKTLNSQSNLEKEKMDLEESTFMMLDSTTKSQE